MNFATLLHVLLSLFTLLKTFFKFVGIYTIPSESWKWYCVIFIISLLLTIIIVYWLILVYLTRYIWFSSIDIIIFCNYIWLSLNKFIIIYLIFNHLVFLFNIFLLIYIYILFIILLIIMIFINNNIFLIHINLIL